nr:brain-specific angiogenesis inhibitor 1-associated protein 2-like protein 2 isoform X3 [Pongo pygmaeus]
MGGNLSKVTKQIGGRTRMRMKLLSLSPAAFPVLPWWPDIHLPWEPVTSQAHLRPQQLLSVFAGLCPARGAEDTEVQTFHGDLLQHMEKNTKLDMQFIKDSRQHYELEYRHRAANLEKCMSELWRMERKRDKNVREMKESVNRLHAQMQAFVSESQRAAELEEKRRYRFLAEKHLLLSNTFLQFFGRARGMLQNRVLLWKEQSEASRSPSRAHSPGLLGPALGPPYPSGRLTPTRLDMPPRPLGEFSSPRSRHGSGSYGPEPDARPASQLEPDRRSLPRTPSACECPRPGAAGGPGEERGWGCSRRDHGQTPGRTSCPRAAALSRPQPRSTAAAPKARAPTPLASARAAAGAPGGSAPWSPTRRAPTTRCCASPPGTWWRCWCPRPRTAGSTASWRARPREWEPWRGRGWVEKKALGAGNPGTCRTEASLASPGGLGQCSSPPGPYTLPQFPHSFSGNRKSRLTKFRMTALESGQRMRDGQVLPKVWKWQKSYCLSTYCVPASGRRLLPLCRVSPGTLMQGAGLGVGA